MSSIGGGGGGGVDIFWNSPLHWKLYYTMIVNQVDVAIVLV